MTVAFVWYTLKIAMQKAAQDIIYPNIPSVIKLDLNSESLPFPVLPVNLEVYLRTMKQH